MSLIMLLVAVLILITAVCSLVSELKRQACTALFGGSEPSSGIKNTPQSAFAADGGVFFYYCGVVNGLSGVICR